MQSSLPTIVYGYIYKITNTINNKSYIGQTTRIPDERFKAYKYIRCNDQPKIYRALKKYGVESFNYSVITTAPDKTILDLQEDEFILLYDAINNGYNCKTGGSRGRPSQESIEKNRISNLGKKHTEETKKKISAGQKWRVGPLHNAYGRKVSAETRKKMSEWQKGKKLSEETKLKLSRVVKTDEWRRKLSEAKKGKGGTFTGRKHTEETKQKISMARRARIAQKKE